MGVWGLDPCSCRGVVVCRRGRVRKSVLLGNVVFAGPVWESFALQVHCNSPCERDRGAKIRVIPHRLSCVRKAQDWGLACCVRLLFFAAASSRCCAQICWPLRRLAPSCCAPLSQRRRQGKRMGGEGRLHHKLHVFDGSLYLAGFP